MIIRSVEEGIKYAKQNGYPVVIRPSYSLNGAGIGTATDEQNLSDLLKKALDLSPLDKLKFCWKL